MEKSCYGQYLLLRHMIRHLTDLNWNSIPRKPNLLTFFQQLAKSKKLSSINLYICTVLNDMEVE